jgi:hypothetical protein
MMDDLTPVLSRLPEPLPPSTLTATVMARIEREAEQRAEASIAEPVTRPRELQVWLWTFVGLTLVLIVFINGWGSGGFVPNFTSARIGLAHAPLMPPEARVSLLLALGLVAYLAGLFAPLRTARRD